MDEVGRGTTVDDGLAISFATVHHLVSVNKCRALFATHFHELSDMLGYSTDHKGGDIFANVAFFCTDVDETEVSSRLVLILHHFIITNRMVTLHIRIVCNLGLIGTVMV